jgi:hypothetical protein
MRFEVFTAVRMMMFFFWALASCRLVSIFRPEDKSMFLRKVCVYRRVYTAPKPRRRKST